MNKSCEHHAKQGRTQRSPTLIGQASHTKRAMAASSTPKSSDASLRHAYAVEVNSLRQAIQSLEAISGHRIPLMAAIELDKAIHAIYRAKGAFDCFSHDER